MVVELLVAGAIGFIVGYLVGAGTQKRLLTDLHKTNLAVLAIVAEILERLTNILDTLVTEGTLDIDLTDEDRQKILEFLNGIVDVKLDSPETAQEGKSKDE